MFEASEGSTRRPFLSSTKSIPALQPAGVRNVEPCEEQRSYDFDEMLRAFDESMPEDLRLGELLDSVEVPAGELEVGDEVWLREHESGWKAYPVVGFGQPAGHAIADRVETADGKVSVTYPDLPYVARYDHDGDFSWNSNNYVHGETARIRPRRETGWECPAGAIDVVAMEDDILVLVEVSARTADEGGFPEGSGLEGRRRRETAAIAYLAEHEDVDRPVRFDDVSLVVFGEGKAFLRHHINALSDAVPVAGSSLPSEVA